MTREDAEHLCEEMFGSILVVQRNHSEIYQEVDDIDLDTMTVTLKGPVGGGLEGNLKRLRVTDFYALSRCQGRGETAMTYPTAEQIELADRIQLARWYRFLPSPEPDEVDRQKRLIERFNELGGMNAAISKRIGWER